jgi:cytochrome bd-type quinol oxidase subunit 2
MTRQSSILMNAAEDLPAAAARLAAAGTLGVASIVVALHAIKSEFEPAWRFISEYAIGRHGWMMQLAFLLWAASSAALAFALLRHVRSLLGQFGVGLLLLVAIALAAAGIFPQDPVTAAPEDQTTKGALHALASMIGIPGLPLAAMLISSSLWRTNTAWRPYRRAIMWPAHATWISLLCMVVYLTWAVPRAGGFTSEVWAGWMNRLVVATYLVWQFTVARLAITRARTPPPRRPS